MLIKVWVMVQVQVLRNLVDKGTTIKLLLTYVYLFFKYGYGGEYYSTQLIPTHCHPYLRFMKLDIVVFSFSFLDEETIEQDPLKFDILMITNLLNNNISVLNLSCANGSLENT